MCGGEGSFVGVLLKNGGLEVFLEAEKSCTVTILSGMGWEMKRQNVPGSERGLVGD